MKLSCLLMIVFLMSAATADYGPAAIWLPPEDFRQQVIADCGGAGARFHECFASRMKKAGASVEAASFSAALSNEAYMLSFRPCGRVSIAAVNYPFRANENSGLLLVNGEPKIVDIDRVEQLSMDNLRPLLERNPKASLWPSSRDKTDRITAEKTAGGGQRFLVEYRVQDGCHACALLGKASYAFTFDVSGKFLGASFLRFTPR